MLGAVAYKVSADQEVKALYTLPARPTVVLVENYRQPDLAATDAELLARCLHARLESLKVVQLVGPEKILELRSKRSKDFRNMTVPDIGRAVGAEQVIYVDLESGGLATMGDASIIRGRAVVLVKVVDVATGETRWPPDLSDGRAVTFETNPTDLTDRVRPDQLRYALYDGLAIQVVRLFTNWRADDALPQ
ncbi:MAG: hypothetical protein H7144_04790 [Burkholderiales bacterium]|nr:hypothetical protein [Phycisphaerae bacterium]